MAEALVLTVIGKIASTLAEEAVKALYSKFGKELSILIEVEEKLNLIASDFRVMQAFLSQIELEERKQVVLEAWLKEVREVAHDVEDIIDEYTYLFGKLRSNSDNFFKKFLHKSKNIISFHDIATRLTNFEPRLENLSKMKNKYEILLPGGSTSNFIGEGQQPLIASSYLMDQEELVGIEQERSTLVTWLKDAENPARSIITIWGMGGSGKTSLLHNIFNNQVIKGFFDIYLWISVSYKYQVVDILKIIVKDVKGGNGPDIDSVDYLILLRLEVRRCLEEKKYLIVLDDVWSKILWNELDYVFPDSNRGSRVVITTRDQEVAELARERYVLELKCLGEKESWDLFCRRAFRNEYEGSCPPELDEWAKKIVSKCQGLPLSLAAIGSLLFYRAREVSQWKKFYNQLNWELTRKENIHELSLTTRTLNLSYHYLPSYLKNCFLYCSIFPEDFMIYKDRLIRCWMAEGFISIEGRERQTPEEVAEEYLNEFIHRCMLQVVGRDRYGKVMTCRMHDIVRELTLTISREQNFCQVVEDPKVARLSERVRRLSVHEFDNDMLSKLNFMSSLRTFIVFKTSLDSASVVSVLSSCKYLRVLDLHGIVIQRVPDCVVDLFNLHYLSLSNTRVKELPESIGKLRNLQTLDLSGTEIKKLPSRVTELKNLRHLSYEHRSSGVEVPKGLWLLKDLQTLEFVNANNELVGRLGELTQIRIFGITGVRGVHCRELCASIAKMRYLLKLEIRAMSLFQLDINAVRNGGTLRMEGGLDGCHQSLEELTLKGQLTEGVVPSSFIHSLGSSLRYLHLEMSGLSEDPLPSLSHLSNLAFLKLFHAYTGQELCFRAGWFPNLKTLWLRRMDHLDRMEIEEGALQSLEELNLWYLWKLKAVPIGIEFLTSLRELDIRGANAELKARMGGIDSIMVARIPVVWVFT